MWPLGRAQLCTIINLHMYCLSFKKKKAKRIKQNNKKKSFPKHRDRDSRPLGSFRQNRKYPNRWSDESMTSDKKFCWLRTQTLVLWKRDCIKSFFSSKLLLCFSHHVAMHRNMFSEFHGSNRHNFVKIRKFPVTSFVSFPKGKVKAGVVAWGYFFE